LLRFWWLPVIGVAAAVVTGTLMVYRVDVKFPPTEVPKFTERTKPSYEARLTLLVDSPFSPYYGTQTREVVDKTQLELDRLRSGGGNRTESDTRAGSLPGEGSKTPPKVETRLIPDRSSLVRAANFYPLLIESDAVTAMRKELTGPIPGVVHARALGARNSGGRTRPSTVPVIELTSLAPRPKQAVLLVNKTSEAFRTWLKKEQKRTKVTKAQTILLKELRAAGGAAPVGGTSYGLPLLTAFAVLLAFGGLAIVLDRAFPKRRDDEADTVVAGDAETGADATHLEVVTPEGEALGDTVARIAREVGALRAEAARRTP
jgi:hypothetical protein